MLMRVHSKKGERIVALCDADLIGRVYKDAKRVLDLKRFAEFYGKEKASEKEAVAQLKSATSINAVGKKSVASVIASGMAGEKDAVEVAGIPHIQVYVLRE